MTLALHGNIGSPADFEAVAKTGGAELQAIDLWPLAHLSLDEVADHLAGISGPRGICGYSMGGRLALHAISRHPERWDYAVIISAHPGLKSEQERAERLASDEGWARRVEEPGNWAEFLSEWNAQGVLAGKIPESQNQLGDQAEPIAAAFRNWSLGRQADLRDSLASSPCPIEWVVGEQDHKFLNLAEDAASHSASIRLRVVPECGHRVLLERPEVVSAAIMAAASRD